MREPHNDKTHVLILSIEVRRSEDIGMGVERTDTLFTSVPYRGSKFLLLMRRSEWLR